MKGAVDAQLAGAEAAPAPAATQDVTPPAGVTRVVNDVSGKPPATIEWE